MPGSSISPVEMECIQEGLVKVSIATGVVNIILYYQRLAMRVTSLIGVYHCEIPDATGVIQRIFINQTA